MGHRLIILSGPSCVGKSPLDKSLGRFFPELRKGLQSLVLYNSRAPRPGELDGVDYHFRTEEQVDELAAEDRFIVIDVRGDKQALDMKELTARLEQADIFFEGNPFIGEILLTHPGLSDINKTSVFMSPLSRDEILHLKQLGADIPALLTDVMRRKLLRRTRKQKGELSQKDFENIERRASSAYQELQKAHYFEQVIPNHDGEDSDNWDAFYFPLGDARLALLDFVAILNGKQTQVAEQWEASLLA